MNRIIRIAGLLSIILWGGVALADETAPATSTTAEITTVQSDTQPKVTFPIAELGGCTSKETCRIYCEDTTHQSACFAFAQKSGLMSKEKIDAAKIIVGKKGPGGCNTRDTCLAYCKDSSHQDECLNFAQEHKIIAIEKVTLIKKLVGGEGPGACKTAESCRAYCSDSSHRDECKTFADQNGIGRKMNMGSTSPAMKMRPMMGSSTPEGARDDMRPRMGSTTQGERREFLQGNASSSSEPKRPIPPPRPERKEGSTTKENLGASVIQAIAHLIGF